MSIRSRDASRVSASLTERPDQFRNTDGYGVYTFVYTICAQGPLIVEPYELIARPQRKMSGDPSTIVRK